MPLIFKAKVDFYLQDDIGQGPSTAYNADAVATMKLTGVQNNWAIRNAAVKWHAAREKQFEKSGLLKAHRGAYAHEIRYAYDQASQTWLSPIDGDGNAFAGGTWDLTEIVTVDDASFQIKLVGDAVSEDSDVNTAVQTLGYSYLASRANLREDTNDEVEEIGDRSILGDMLADAAMPVGTREVISGNVEDEQDQVPYDHFAAGDTANDITEGVELGRATAEVGRSYGSMEVEIPFGLCDVRTAVQQAATSTLEPNGLMCVEVLDIYEMTG